MTDSKEIHRGIRVTLHPFTDEHLTERYVAWLSDEEVTRYSERRGGNHTLESCRDYAQALAKAGDWFLAIHASGEDASDVHVGNISVYFERRDRNADVAILVGDKKWWGKGVGHRAFVAACDAIWKNTDVEKITAGTLASNLPMLRIMQKAGMEPDGVRRFHAIRNGQRIDIVYYALFRERAGNC